MKKVIKTVGGILLGFIVLVAAVNWKHKYDEEGSANIIVETGKATKQVFAYLVQGWESE